MSTSRHVSVLNSTQIAEQNGSEYVVCVPVNRGALAHYSDAPRTHQWLFLVALVAFVMMILLVIARLNQPTAAEINLQVKQMGLEHEYRMAALQAQQQADLERMAAETRNRYESGSACRFLCLFNGD